MSKKNSLDLSRIESIEKAIDEKIEKTNNLTQEIKSQLDLLTAELEQKEAENIAYSEANDIQNYVRTMRECNDLKVAIQMLRDNRTLTERKLAFPDKDLKVMAYDIRETSLKAISELVGTVVDAIESINIESKHKETVAVIEKCEKVLSKVDFEAAGRNITLADTPTPDRWAPEEIMKRYINAKGYCNDPEKARRIIDPLFDE